MAPVKRGHFSAKLLHVGPKWKRFLIQTPVTCISKIVKLDSNNINATDWDVQILKIIFVSSVVSEFVCQFLLPHPELFLVIFVLCSQFRIWHPFSENPSCVIMFAGTLLPFMIIIHRHVFSMTLMFSWWFFPGDFWPALKTRAYVGWSTKMLPFYCCYNF